MGKCVNHPDKETSYICTKHDLYMCDECIRCRDPEIYCKFRSSCIVHFLDKQQQAPRQEECGKSNET